MKMIAKNPYFVRVSRLGNLSSPPLATKKDLENSKISRSFVLFLFFLKIKKYTFSTLFLIFKIYSHTLLSIHIK